MLVAMHRHVIALPLRFSQQLRIELGLSAVIPSPHAPRVPTGRFFETSRPVHTPARSPSFISDRRDAIRSIRWRSIGGQYYKATINKQSPTNRTIATERCQYFSLTSSVHLEHISRLEAVKVFLGGQSLPLVQSNPSIALFVSNGSCSK